MHEPSGSAYEGTLQGVGPVGHIGQEERRRVPPPHTWLQMTSFGQTERRHVVSQNDAYLGNGTKDVISGNSKGFISVAQMASIQAHLNDVSCGKMTSFQASPNGVMQSQCMGAGGPDIFPIDVSIGLL